jgi:Tfp pilus assembly protein PilP
MKRTLTFCLLCGLAVSSAAQTPTVVEKSGAPAKVASGAKAVQVKPLQGHAAPSNVKVVAVHAAPAKPSAVVVKTAAKPAVVAVAPVPKSVVNVSVPKPAAQSGHAPAAKATAVAVKVEKPTPPATVHVVTKASVKAAPAVKARVAASSNQGPFGKGKAPKPAVQAHVDLSKAAGTKPNDKSKPAVVAVNENKAAEEKKSAPKKISAADHRDPFVSPVVRLGAIGSGCSSGKRCLAIDQVALKGVVRSENGMIAVVVNSMDKAYFLRENDPVFNGYVTRITPDSIIFKETFHDKLGKELTRDVTKTITRPAA